MLLSVLLPAKDESENIAALLQEIHQALKGTDHEIILVDDGSRDSTAALAVETSKSLTCPVTVIRHAKSCGQSTAMHTALNQARGTWIATLDADGQNDPHDIPKLIHAADTLTTSDFCIIGHRKNRKDNGWKRLQSRIANAIRQRILRDGTPDTGCGLKLLPRSTFLKLPYFHHMHRYTPALVKRLGGDIISVAVNHRPRTAGVSKYTALNRAFAGIWDLMGVYWLIRRARIPEIVGVEPQDPQGHA